MRYENPSAPRLKQLDGLRGLAAFSVFLSHGFGLMATDNAVGHFFTSSFVRPLWDGFSAVVMFFLLSGFVLTLPYTGQSPKRIDVAPFLIRRIARLYPAYWVGILIALFLRCVVLTPSGLYGLSEWSNSLWHLPITRVSLIQHFFMIAPGIPTAEIDPVIWSLIAEVKISLIFPAVLVLVRMTKKAQYAILILGCVFACNAFFHLLGTFLIFLMGSYLAKYRYQIVGVLSASAWLRVALALLGYVLYGASSILPFPQTPGSDLAVALGAGMWLSLFLSSSALKWIGTSPPVEFLGDISYSFYLIHLPILLAVTSVLNPRIGSPLLCIAICLACSLVVAYAIYSWIEIPGQNLGKLASRAWSKRIGESAAAHAGTK